MHLENTVTHNWDWWAYQFRVIHRRDIAGIDSWDDRVVAFVSQALGLQPDDRLLDLACGSGAHALRFAQRGIEVVGLDISSRLVRHCTEQAADAGLSNVTFVEGDMRTLSYQNEFDALVMLSTSFGFFDHETNLQVLDGLTQAIKPSGRLLLQLSDPISFVERHQERRYWQERPEGVYLTEGWFDPSTFTSHGKFRFTDNDGVTHLWDDHERVRLYTLPELRCMFAQVGLEVSDVYGSIYLHNMDYGPDNHQEMIVVGRPKQANRF